MSFPQFPTFPSLSNLPSAQSQRSVSNQTSNTTQTPSLRQTNSINGNINNNYSNNNNSSINLNHNNTSNNNSKNQTSILTTIPKPTTIKPHNFTPINTNNLLPKSTTQTNQSNLSTPLTTNNKSIPTPSFPSISLHIPATPIIALPSGLNSRRSSAATPVQLRTPATLPVPPSISSLPSFTPTLSTRSTTTGLNSNNNNNNSSLGGLNLNSSISVQSSPKHNNQSQRSSQTKLLDDYNGKTQSNQLSTTVTPSLSFNLLSSTPSHNQDSQQQQSPSAPFNRNNNNNNNQQLLSLCEVKLKTIQSSTGLLQTMMSNIFKYQMNQIQTNANSITSHQLTTPSGTNMNNVNSTITNLRQQYKLLFEDLNTLYASFGLEQLFNALTHISEQYQNQYSIEQLIEIVDQYDIPDPFSSQANNNNNNDNASSEHTRLIIQPNQKQYLCLHNQYTNISNLYTQLVEEWKGFCYDRNNIPQRFLIEGGHNVETRSQLSEQDVMDQQQSSSRQAPEEEILDEMNHDQPFDQQLRPNERNQPSQASQASQASQPNQRKEEQQHQDIDPENGYQQNETLTRKMNQTRRKSAASIQNSQFEELLTSPYDNEFGNNNSGHSHHNHNHFHNGSNSLNIPGSYSLNDLPNGSNLHNTPSVGGYSTNQIDDNSSLFSHGLEPNGQNGQNSSNSSNHSSSIPAHPKMNRNDDYNYGKGREKNWVGRK